MEYKKMSVRKFLYMARKGKVSGNTTYILSPFTTPFKLYNKTKLKEIEEGAQVNEVTGANILAKINASSEAGKITNSQLVDLPASKITSGEFNADRIPSLAISKITDLQDTIDGIEEDVAANVTVDFIYREITSGVETITNGLPAGWVITSVWIYNQDHSNGQDVRVRADSTVIYNNTVGSDTKVLEMGCCDLTKGFGEGADQDIIIDDGNAIPTWHTGINICIKIEKFYQA